MLMKRAEITGIVGEKVVYALFFFSFPKNFQGTIYFHDSAFGFCFLNRYIFIINLLWGQLLPACQRNQKQRGRFRRQCENGTENMVQQEMSARDSHM